MKPTEKAPQIESLISTIAGKDRHSVVPGKGCMTCDSPNTDFRDDLSRKEYAISGMCQNCQDSVWGVDEEGEEN